MTSTKISEEQIAFLAYSDALRANQTWRHAIRDVLEATLQARAGAAWRCPTCTPRQPKNPRSALKSDLETRDA